MGWDTVSSARSSDRSRSRTKRVSWGLMPDANGRTTDTAALSSLNPLAHSAWRYSDSTSSPVRMPSLVSLFDGNRAG